MPTTKKQREANRANSKKSTGPKTAEGKTKSSLNGMRHCLTGQIVCMPEDDMEQYKEFTLKLRAHYQPEGPLEAQIAQGIADDEWRLNRIRS